MLEVAINTLVYLMLVMLPGIAMVMLELATWKRRLAKFGAPPAGHHRGTLLSFIFFSLAFMALSWLYTGLATLVAVGFFLLVYLGRMTGLLDFGLTNLVNFKEMAWSRKQQARDGFAAASWLVLPAVIFFEAGHVRLAIAR